MKRPLAYLTAAWSGEPDVDMELAAHYCRLAYEAGFSPICPLLYLPPCFKRSCSISFGGGPPALSARRRKWEHWTGLK